MSPLFGVRELSADLTFNKAAATILFNDCAKINYVLGFLNSKVTQSLLKIINPTINNNIRDILNMPCAFEERYASHVDRVVDECIKESRYDWDSYETSWDFKRNPLV